MIVIAPIVSKSIIYSIVAHYIVPLLAYYCEVTVLGLIKCGDNVLLDLGSILWWVHVRLAVTESNENRAVEVSDQINITTLLVVLLKSACINRKMGRLKWHDLS